MTTNSRFLALVAKVDATDEILDNIQGFTTFEELDTLRKTNTALKGEIMRHEPDEDGYCKSCIDYFNTRTETFLRQAFPCKPFEAIATELGFNEPSYHGNGLGFL